MHENKHSAGGKDCHMKTKRLLALLFACVALVFASCNNTDDGKGNTDLGETAVDDYTGDLHIEDYNQYNFRMLVRPAYMADQYVEDGSSDIVENAVYKRNKTVEEMFNITISANESSTNGFETDALNAILAGDDAYDMILCHNGAALSYATQGAAVNIHDVETIHTDKPWWTKDIVEGCTLGGNLYVLDGDISTHRLRYAMCLFFNKDIFDELGLEYPYQLVDDGEWTFDEFASLVKQGASDLDGDGAMTIEKDRFGFLTNHWQMPIAVIYTGGQRIYTKNTEGILELTLNSMKTVDIYDSFFELCDTESTWLHNNEVPNGENAFKDGRALFTDQTLGSAINMRTMEDNFGILPYPKYEYEDVYATVTNGFANLMVIPVTVEDEERTGAIIEALCAIGSREVIPAFYEQSLKTKFTRDNESEGMIDIIRDSLVYDVGYAKGAFGYMGNVLANKASHDFSSVYAASESSALNSLKNFNEAYADYKAE